MRLGGIKLTPSKLLYLIAAIIFALVALNLSIGTTINLTALGLALLAVGLLLA